MNGLDKLFMPVHERPLLAYSLATFQACTAIEQIVLVLSQNNLVQGRDLVCREGFSKVTAICLGGERRQDSVVAGLKSLQPCRFVAVHDAARPLVSAELIEKGLAIAAEVGAAVPAMPVVDTVKEVDEAGQIVRTLSRQRLWAAQTPQIFRYDWLLDAHERVLDDVTDDAAMLESLGYPVKVYPGSPRNLKITTPQDVALLETFLSQR
jgi:2-C-methyl-D-erythritol 4-phosphate cytidylyltransferase